MAIAIAREGGWASSIAICHLRISRRGGEGQTLTVRQDRRSHHASATETLHDAEQYHVDLHISGVTITAG